MCSSMESGGFWPRCWKCWRRFQIPEAITIIMTNTTQCDVIIIGAGPAGSAAAAILAERGLSAVIIEREKFPRYHIGESLLPFTCYPLKRLGLLEKMQQS